jgi:subtilisin family serine protease
MTRTRFFAVLFCGLCLTAVGCTDQMLTEPSDAPVEEAPSGDLLRNGHLMDRAVSSAVSGKRDDSNVFALMAYDQYEADGVTRRVLDAYGITRRILDEYGVTRRVLDSYGVTRRVLEEYGITRRVLDQYTLDIDLLEQYGITRRILDEYQVSRDELEHELASFESVIKLRLQMNGSTPGASTEIDAAYWDVIRNEMAGDRDLSYLEPDPATTVALPTGGYAQRNQKNFQMMPWNVTRIGGGYPNLDLNGVRVYVLDSGVNIYDLNVAERKDFTVLFQNRNDEFWDDDDYQPTDEFDPGNSGDPSDGNGHGTHIAGIIGALDNSLGVVGVAPGVAIHSLKVLTENGRTDVTTLVAAVRYVIKQKERARSSERFVVNLSLGMNIETEGFNILDETIAEAIDAGIHVVVSAGNDASNAATYSPAHVPTAITVGAYDMSDRFAGFSNFGGVVDLLAPGVDVASLPHLASQQQLNSLIIQTGTSMAAPHVAGAAALYLAANPLASPRDVEIGLQSLGRAGIQRLPEATTETSVDVSWANGPESNFPLSVDVAEWVKRKDELILEGRGPGGSVLTIRAAVTNKVLGQVVVGRNGKWGTGISRPTPVPCAVIVHTQPANGQSGELAARSVTGAPNNCQ